MRGLVAKTGETQTPGNRHEGPRLHGGHGNAHTMVRWLEKAARSLLPGEFFRGPGRYKASVQLSESNRAMRFLAKSQHAMSCGRDMETLLAVLMMGITRYDLVRLLKKAGVRRESSGVGVREKKTEEQAASSHFEGI